MTRMLVILALTFSLVPVAGSARDISKPQPKQDGKADTGTPPTRASKSCKAFGEGFVYIESTGSCVKAGGYLRFEAGSSR